MSETRSKLLMHFEQKCYSHGTERFTFFESSPIFLNREQKKQIKSNSDALNKVWDIISAANEMDCSLVHQLDDDIQEETTLCEIDEALLKAPSPADFEKAFEELKKSLKQVNETCFSLLKAIYQFRNQLESQSTTGELECHYPLFEEATLLYLRHYELFGNSELSPKNIFCWQKVLGYTDRFLPKSADHDTSWHLGYNCALSDAKTSATGSKEFCKMRKVHLDPIISKKSTRQPKLTCVMI